MDDELSTVETIEALMDDDGFLPGDEDFQEEDLPDIVEDDEEGDDEDGDDLDEAEDDLSDDEDEVDGDSEDGGDDSEGDDDEGDPEGDSGLSDETLLDLQIGDDVYEVNLAELKSGYLRNEEYVVRMEALQEEHDSKVLELELKQSELLKELEVASVISTGDLSKYNNINWEQLKAQDPARYNELRVEAIEAQEATRAMVHRRNTIARLDTEAKRLKHEAYVKDQLKIAETLVPDLQDEDKRNAMIAYAQSIGFSQEDIMGIADAKTLLLLNNARLYAESQVRRKEAKSKKVKAELPRVMKPGAPVPRASKERMASKATAGRLRAEQSVDAAAAHFMNVVNFD